MLEPDVDFGALAVKLPARLSGADIYAFCAGALTRAIHERISCDRITNSAAERLNGDLLDSRGVSKTAEQSHLHGEEAGADSGNTDEEGCSTSEDERGFEKLGEAASLQATRGSGKAKRVELPVGMRHFEAAVEEVTPSVSADYSVRYHEGSQDM